jgi:hypothetical protein
MEYVVAVVQNLPKWKDERLPPPRTNQSQYDKVGLTRKHDVFVSSTALMFHSFAMDVGRFSWVYRAFDVPLCYANAVSVNLIIPGSKAEECEDLKSCACRS